MPKEITITIYEYNELNEKAKEKARDWWLEVSDEESAAFEFIQEDAKRVGLDIKEVRFATVDGDFIISAIECSNSIYLEHGEKCKTYALAQKFQAAIENLPESNKDAEGQVILDNKERELCASVDALESEFLSDLLHAYYNMYQEDIEYRQSEESIVSAMEANGYTFNVNGKREG